MVMKKDLLSSFSLSASQIQDILKYVDDNMETIPKISLRLAIKLAQLVKDSPDNWYQMANTGLLNQSN
jgi:5'-3' exonuclease